MQPMNAPGPGTWQFGISEFTTWPWTFQQDVERYAKLGVDTIEVCEFKLDPNRIQQQLASTKDHGLRISSAQPSVRTLYPSKSQPKPTEIADRMTRFRETIASFGTFAANTPFVTNTGIPPGGDIQLVLDTAVREYRDLSDYAATKGALIALEPLNASIMNLESAIWTLDQAMEIVQQVDRANFGICLDYWNVWQNAGIDEAIKSSGDKIFVVQISDWRTPRSDQDRLIPGDGEIPLAQLLKATRDAGFSGAYSVEIFSGNIPDSIWDGNLDEVIKRSREGVERAWQTEG